MTEPVDFTTAKLLKEKGYSWECKDFYCKDKHSKKFHLTTGTEYDSDRAIYYSAPTVSEVIMWLYKKHKIWIYVHKDGGWWFPVIENYYDEDDQGTIIENLSKLNKNYFNEPTEAYEKAIEYTLKILI